MTLYELISFHKELLHRLSDAGVRTGDYRYADLFRDYTEMIQAGYKVTYAVAVLSERYRVSERTVYALLRRLARNVKLPLLTMLNGVLVTH